MTHLAGTRVSIRATCLEPGVCVHNMSPGPTGLRAFERAVYGVLRAQCTVTCILTRRSVVVWCMQVCRLLVEVNSVTLVDDIQGCAMIWYPSRGGGLLLCLLLVRHLVKPAFDQPAVWQGGL